MRRDSGLTLVELVISIFVISLIALSAAALMNTSLDMYASAGGRSDAYHEAERIMALLRRDIQTTQMLFIPNGAAPNTTSLVIAAGINQDNDFYGGNSRFPRVDEDYSADMNNDDASGMQSVGGLLGGLLGGLGSLFANKNDDDGDGSNNEDPRNGHDDDGDGRIDEDSGGDINSDGSSGIRNVDDNLDGVVDTANTDNDDEDATLQEDWLEALVYHYDANTDQLKRTVDGSATTIVANNLNAFNLTYEGGTSTLNPRLRVRLTVPRADGTDLIYEEYIIPKNLLQNDGRRVQ